MKRLNILWIGLISVLMTACYDDYEKDYDKSSVYFASQKCTFLYSFDLPDPALDFS